MAASGCRRKLAARLAGVGCGPAAQGGFLTIRFRAQNARSRRVYEDPEGHSVDGRLMHVMISYWSVMGRRFGNRISPPFALRFSRSAG
jgi:hypothetical protein